MYADIFGIAKNLICKANSTVKYYLTEVNAKLNTSCSIFSYIEKSNLFAIVV